MGKSIRDAMTDNPRQVEATTPVTEAAKLMASEDVGSLPVTEGDRLIGMGVIPWTNVDDAIAELHHCARLGLKGVNLGVFQDVCRHNDGTVVNLDNL